jgi:hypothetical protein
MLERWPTADALHSATRDELVAFARDGRHSRPEQFADRVAQALAGEHFTPRGYLVRAKEGTIRLTAALLLAIGAQRRAWERRMGKLLLGAPRRGRAKQPREDELGEAVPGGEVYLSFPGLGDRLAARVAGEIGAIATFETPNALQMLRGQGAGHQAQRQKRARRRGPARLQRSSARCDPAVGVLQPAQLAVGASLLRRPASARQGPPRRPAGTR